MTLKTDSIKNVHYYNGQPIGPNFPLKAGDAYLKTGDAYFIYMKMDPFLQ
jgi:hypothetical protein